MASSTASSPLPSDNESKNEGGLNPAPKPTRRGTAVSSTSTLSSGKDSNDPRHRNTHRRVSFTGGTSTRHPPSDVTAEEHGMRRSSLSSLQATPHQSIPAHGNNNSSASLHLSHTFPQGRNTAPYRSQPVTSRRASTSSRRSSLDSCSSYSSGVSSSFYSAASVASVFSYKDDSFQRSKILTCLEWLSRQISRYLVQQLMQQVQQEQSAQPLEGVPIHHPGTRRASTSAIRRRSRAKTLSAPRRHSQPTPANLSSISFKKRPSCSFVHCDAPRFPASLDQDEELNRSKRLLKTRESLDRLSSQDALSSEDDDEDAMLVLGYESSNTANSWSTRENVVMPQIPLPPPTPHRAVLLVIDISGFTNLATTLPLQALSQTINAYFQSIIECIQEYGGDVVKFAGDAVWAEWRIEGDDVDTSTKQADCCRTEDSRITQVAVACACRIVQRCADYHVYQHLVASPQTKNDDDKGKLLATLNVHCALGCGQVVGFHAGDGTRREYMLLGGAIPQAADAIAVGRGGEVVASPQAYEILVGSIKAERKKSDTPQVIFSARKDRFETTPQLLDPDMLLLPPTEMDTSSRGKWTLGLEDWDLAALKKLQNIMSLYVHAAVVEGELFTTVYHNHRGAPGGSQSFDSDGDQPGNSQPCHEKKNLIHDQRVYQSEAEIRKVFTLFLQPLVSVDLTGDPLKDDAVMTMLNEILVLTNEELSRFKGHLRQFMVDDKGVVLIANFGLRGSMSPRMIENHAMPFATSIQSVLKSELNVDCRMGATFGNAYCGIVGGVERHEFSVLGPAVNLSARLMCNPQNHGFLVEESVRREAHGWQFNAREPVRAKGYAHQVPIFEPVSHHRLPWQGPNGGFVGREEEIENILEFSDDVVLSRCLSAKMILISGEGGFGKTSMLSEAVNRIQQRSLKQNHSQLILGQVCCEDDLFRPMSILGPVLLDALTKAGDFNAESIPDDASTAIKTVRVPAGATAQSSGETAVAVEQFHAACKKADISEEKFETLRGFVFNQDWPTLEVDSDGVTCWQRLSSAERDEIARSFVAVLLQTTVSFDLVLLAVDDISLMDELSWKVTQLWFEHACNLVIIGTSKPVICKDINIAPSFWEYLFSSGFLVNRFLHIELPPLSEGDIQRLIAQGKYARVSQDDSTNVRSISPEIGFAREVYLQSGGIPRLAASMVERLAFGGDNSVEPSDHSLTYGRIPQATSVATEALNINEHILHRMDAIPAVVRTHLNLCAMLGDSFSIRDVVLVMEKYRGVDEKDKEEHSEFVRDTLNEAVWQGILELEGDLAESEVGETFGKCRYGLYRYKFTHQHWRTIILQLTLESWQQDMRQLITESSAAVLECQRQDPPRTC